MVKFKNAVLFLLSIAVAALFVWWLHGKLFPAPKLYSHDISNPAFAGYLADELDLSLPFYTESQGGDCVKFTRNKGMNYSAYFGWHSQHLDKHCAQQHFSGDWVKVIYFGGSVMQNFEAPNYLTRIDNYVQNHNAKIKSINLAESGGRSTNNMIRVMLEGIDLGADFWVFLDGYNEFNSIRYGGNYDEDFYWTATINDRIHRPLKFLADSLISRSRLAEKIFYETGLIKTPRLPSKRVINSDIIKAADYYVENSKKIAMICAAKGVQCLFFLQPNIYTKQTLSATETALAANQTVRHILRVGYARIREQMGEDLIDLTDVFAAAANTVYIDEVHVNKIGSKLIGEAIYNHLQQRLSQDYQVAKKA